MNGSFYLFAALAVSEIVSAKNALHGLRRLLPNDYSFSNAKPEVNFELSTNEKKQLDRELFDHTMPLSTVSLNNTFIKKGIFVYGNSSELSIISFSSDTVLVEGNLMNDLIQGTYLVTDWNENLCFDCPPMFRKITDVADGPTASTKLLKTLRASFADIFYVSLFPVSISDEKIEPLFQNHHTGGARFRFQSNPKKHDLQLLSCNSFRSKRPDGHCSYTDCFVGQTGNADYCFSCNTTCNNGCGPSGGPSFDGNFGLFNFGEACCSHDYCYSTSSFSKVQCDLAFYNQMRSACLPQTPSKLIEKVTLPIKLASLSTFCPLAAKLFFSVVFFFGGQAYTVAQEKQKAHESTPICVV